VNRSETVVLCDLGGVLIDLNWISHARSLFGAQATAEYLKEKWLNLLSVKLFEAGKISFSEFYRQFCAETGSEISQNDFKKEFIGILGNDKPGCIQILTRLAQRCRLAMLSNTNELHVEELKKTSQVFGVFDELFFSYEMGLVKPDLQIFAVVCEKLVCKPSEVLFFDDSDINIAAAREFGINAWRVDSPQEIEKIVDSWQPQPVL
jgi:putative hydrolase of the HAD superfamily